jgi:RNA polymerase sigma-70 factor (sigma-E family)
LARLERRCGGTDRAGPVSEFVVETVKTDPLVVGDQAAGGWPEGFVALYRSKYRPMVRLAYLLVGSTPVAEEIVQDAFVQVHPKLSHVENPAQYLRAAVVNGCRNHLRRRAVERRHLQLADRSVSDAGGDVLADAIRTLPARQRAVVVLRFYEQMSEREIAEVLGCRPGTVKSSCARGLAALRKVIER